MTVARVRTIPRSQRKRLEKCSIEKRQPYQPKRVAAETVDPNRTYVQYMVNLEYSSRRQSNGDNVNPDDVDNDSDFALQLKTVKNLYL